ncbi:MAG: Zn-ribbon domain-containing OB-fold protein [Conexivisphaera sp.]
MVLPPIAYWRSKHNYYSMVGSVCRSCGSAFYPPVRMCPKCGSRELEPAPMPQGGRILSYTRTIEVGTSFRRYRPLTFGLVELDNGAVVLGQLVDFSEDELKPGARVRAVIRKLREDGTDGIIYYGLKFAPER